MLTIRKRTILSAAQKCEICETKERESNLSNITLGLQVNNALNIKQDIDNNILKTKAVFFAKRFSIDDFHQLEGWLTGFKKRHGLHQFKKQGETSSAPSVESIENDRLALQEFLKSYNPEDI
ncbi:homeodomain-like DNA binding domain-containing transcription factor [Rhizophagus clarus]|uniref:Homeodomain-like DNA binding domain-containing transcription factor n=1 Tax=Rhizophagus clarus TaxID=94130 RepID=A0A8H3KW40_9GLOM|nr:homeodomain-like DNA binding domain-containing transcription factor [Rhizophagus clarus]